MTDARKKNCPRILIVDDDPDHCQLMSDSLLMYYEAGCGDQIKCVFSGKECLSEPLEKYDVILLDMYLPDILGLEVLDGILGMADVPVIFVTGEQDLTVAAEAIEKGAQDYVVKHGDYLLAIPAIVQKNISLHRIKLEKDHLQSRLRWMVQELRSKNEQLKESMEKLRYMATRDSLTDLVNRRYFNEQLARQFNEATRYSIDLSCCMIDLDNFKQFNDTLGHQLGDELLQITAEEIRSSLRGPDIAGRYGGDEFVLLLPHTSAEEAISVVQRIRENMVREFQNNQRLRVPVTLCVGISSLQSDYPTTHHELVSMADQALYYAKDLGKNRIMLFSKMRQESETSLNASEGLSALSQAPPSSE